MAPAGRLQRAVLPAGTVERAGDPGPRAEVPRGAAAWGMCWKDFGGVCTPVLGGTSLRRRMKAGFLPRSGPWGKSGAVPNEPRCRQEEVEGTGREVRAQGRLFKALGLRPRPPGLPASPPPPPGHEGHEGPGAKRGDDGGSAPFRRGHSARQKQRVLCGSTYP